MGASVIRFTQWPDAVGSGIDAVMYSRQLQWSWCSYSGRLQWNSGSYSVVATGIRLVAVDFGVIARRASLQAELEQLMRAIEAIDAGILR